MFAVVVLALGLTFAWGSASEPAFAAPLTIDQCNYVDSGAAEEIECRVRITNNIDMTTGVTSSVVETTICIGVPGDTVCVTTPEATLTDIVDVVDQCNNSANTGGSIVTCNVEVTNNITGDADTSPATVNQCIGSGQGGGDEPTTQCDPVESTTNADVTQCNTAGNGGGATERVQCSVGTSTVSAALPVTIRQCNDSANGGGDLVTCNARITTFVTPAQVDPTTSTTTAPAETTTTLAPTPTTTTPPTTPTPTTIPATTVAPVEPTFAPSETLPTNTLPANTLPTNTLPTNTLPTNTLVINTLPTNTYPTNTLPSTGSATDATSGVAFAALILGLGALFLARRRPVT